MMLSHDVGESNSPLRTFAHPHKTAAAQGDLHTGPDLPGLRAPLASVGLRPVGSLPQARLTEMSLWVDSELGLGVRADGVDGGIGVLHTVQLKNVE